MAAHVEEVSKITAKGQTTIPKVVRQAFGVDCGGKIAFEWMETASPSGAPMTTWTR